MSTSIIGDLSEFLSLIKTDFYTEDELLPDVHMRIVVTETKKEPENCSQCVAMVRNVVDGVQQAPYQCTRKKKYGDYCGLHAGRQTQFTHISEYRNEKRKIYYIKLSDLPTV